VSLHTQLLRGLLALPLLLALLLAGWSARHPVPAPCAAHAPARATGAPSGVPVATRPDNGGMFDVILFQPEIPPNTGNAIRLCANTGARLHLVEPLGFALDDRRLRRAGLDYHEYARVRVHADLDTALAEIGQGRTVAPRVFALSTRGTVRFDTPAFAAGDVFLFGPETRGLPDNALAVVPTAQRLRLPMCAHNRSLNLSNAIAVVVFEAWRQQGYAGAAGA